MFAMTIPRLAIAALSLSIFALSPAATTPAFAAEIQLQADLGHSVLSTRKSDKTYLRLSLKTLAGIKAERRPPINVALVIDRSGSMTGDRIEAAKKAAHVALDRLSADDIVSVVTYNHRVDVLAPAGRLGAARQEIERAIDKLAVDGTTALYDGTKEGGEQVQKFLSDTKVNRVVLISDGLANVGPSSPQELGELGRKLAGKGISVTTIGLGLDYNEDLMQRLASASDGNHAFVESPRQLAGIFDKEFGDALSIAAQDVTIIIECRAGFKPTRVLGREADIAGSTIKLKLNQLQADNERYVVIEMETPSGGKAGDADVADIKVEYLDLDTSARSEKQASVRARLSDDDKDVEGSINKAVLAQVTAQIATEQNEKAVELRDKGDVSGARKMLQDNAAYIKRSRETYSSGLGAVAGPSVETLSELEKKNEEASRNLDGEQWNKTRKSMRYDQHKAKVQQKY
jgi:Ca-activated chloride channel family protein